MIRAGAGDREEIRGENGLPIAVEWLVTSESAASKRSALGRAVYPPAGAEGVAGVGWHRHPNAEEIVIVLSGTAEHCIRDEQYFLGPGDICFIPRMTPHRMANPSSEPLTILWFYGGASDLDSAGFEELSGPF